ncbi:hypothetical protein HYR54_14865 [Candidatus Acetothermia bacterium]|nr:hypothetical protein [Candidatus Acetothermia bacterium]
MKRITIAKPGAGSEGNTLVDAQLPPGTTARDVLRSVGLDQNYFLAKWPAPGQAPIPFGETESLFEKVGDGEKLLAASKASMG